MFKNKLKAVKKIYLSGCQKAGAFMNAPSKQHIQLMLLGIGVGLVSFGLVDAAMADQNLNQNPVVDGTAFRNATCVVFRYLEGSFGALVMVASGVGAILSAAFGQYRAALGLMVVAIGSFIIRSLTATFFGQKNANGGNCTENG
jgi:hypothetical protein